MAVWRVGTHPKGSNFYQRTAKQCADEPVLECLSDTAWINGKPVRGMYEETSLQQGSELDKMLYTTMRTFCYPDCEAGWVSEQMPVEYDGQLYGITHKRPARYQGWTCLTLNCCKKIADFTGDKPKLGEVSYSDPI